MTALKTTSLRLRGTSVDILNEEGVDSEGAVTSKSKLQSKVKALSGVDILTETGEYKSTYEILSQIADVWEDINDMDQAALLELISGKRNASVIAAILQNPKELKEAFEDASDAEGSALKENEKYLDSIQGRIDLLTNAIQTLWSNALDSDVVKFFVNIVTELVKFVDQVGLLGTALGGVFIYLTAFKKQTPLALLKQILGVIQNIGTSIKANGFGNWIGSLLGVVPAMKAVTGATFADTLAKQANNKEIEKQILENAKLLGVTTTLSPAQREAAKNAILQAMATKNAATGATQLTTAQGNAMLATLGFSSATHAADGSLKALDATTKSFMATNPIGWILAIVSVVMTVVMLLSQIPSEIESLTTKLDDLKSEMSAIESEIKSINSELQTTQDRMAELLALPSLSFTEQEELEKLKIQTAELERQLELQKMLQKSKEDDIAYNSNKYIDRVWNSSKLDKTYTIDADGVISKDGFWTSGLNTKDAIDQSISKYKENDETANIMREALINWDQLSDYDKYALTVRGKGEHTAGELVDEDKWVKWAHFNQIASKEDVEKYLQEAEDNNKKIAAGINMVFSDENFDGLKYGMSTEIDKFLDELYAYQYKWYDAQGLAGKSPIIASIFDDTSSNSIKKLKEDLSKIADDDTLDAAQKQKKALALVNEAINSTTGNYDRLKTSMDIIGITADEVARYFVQLSEAPDSSTVEGITAQYQKGVDALGKYKGVATDIIAEFTDLDGTVEQITWGSLFDDEGEAIDTQISKVLQGADETARKEFARIAEAVNEGKMSVDNAMKSFSISGVQAGYKLIESAVVELNSDIFKDLGDEISGLIDTFDEFSSALESVADAIDLVNQAQAEMAYSGHVSVETALALINSTEDWNKVLKIENGNITLVDGAIDILAQSKLNQIKTNLQLALSEAQAGLEQARLAESSGEVAKTLEESTTESVRQLAANMEYLSTLIGEFLAGNFLGAGKAAATAKENSLKKTEYQKTDTTQSMSVADWEEKVANIESKLSILEGVDTTGEFEENYSSSTASGGTDNPEDAEKKKAEDSWEKLISEYENKLALITNERDLIQAEIDRIEAQGGQASKAMYDDLIRSQLEEKKLLEEKKKALEDYLAEHGDSIDPETWTEYNNAINETAVAIKECETNIIDFAKALHDIDMHYFNQAIDEISRLGEEIEFVMSLFEDEEMFDEDGNWTDAGITKINLLKDLITTYAATANMWKDRMTDLDSMEVGENGLYKFDEDTKNRIAADFKSMLDSGQIDQATYDEYMKQLEEAWAKGGFSKEVWTEWKNEAEDGWRGAVSAGQDAQDQLIEMNDARIDAIEEGIQKEIEAYEDYIDVLKESLDAERDLYDFKKNVKKQSKDIASIERRIAALSGSTNASDIAERRKLEAELLEAKEGLNDTYYEHSRDQQSQALDDEAEAFGKAKEKYVEYWREYSKDSTAVLNDMFLNGIFNADVANEFLLGIQEKYGIPLSTELTTPWATAAETATGLKEKVGVPVDNTVTMISDSIIDKLGTDDENNPWNKAVNMASKYANFLTSSEFSIDNNDMTTFEGQINSIVKGWNDVKTAADNAYNAQNRKVTVGGNPNAGNTPTGGGDQSGGGGNGGGGTKADERVRSLQKILNSIFGAGLSEDGIWGSKTEGALKKAQENMRKYLAYNTRSVSMSVTGKFDAQTHKGMSTYFDHMAVVAENNDYPEEAKKYRDAKKKMPVAFHAKGTLGTKQSGLAITDESWIGEEITLAAGKNGQLQYLKKGSAVMPADISANLIEWGKLNPDMMKIGGGANINMISNAVNKPELNLNFEALVKAERIDESTLPEVKKFVQQEINNLVKQMNYALRGKGAR